uniref:mitogen-activated protein kinase HOG1-like n=1 Tax=Monopterus albus TaxID=43700 RepID=UPI0009B42C69|nr:mitogen-activated protein kinase HOG1-like [Monopterus albus]
MENYLKQSIVGKGSYGTVYKVKCRRTGKEFALKYHTRDVTGVRAATGVEEDVIGVEEATVRELSSLSALKGHPYVIQMLDCFVDSGTIAVLMPYVPYTLSKAIHNGHGMKFYYDQGQALQQQQGIPLSFVARFSIQVANALSYMHRLNFVHRDVTPFNVLLTEELTVKVADMGLARHSSRWMSTTVVTEPYRAPELFVTDGCAQYTCAIDTWSLGVMIADAVEGKVVFSARKDHGTEVSTYQIIVRTLCPKDHPCASTVEPWDPDVVMPNAMKCKLVKRIILRLLAFHENERLLAHELLQDTEWTQAAHMTEEDTAMVRDQIRRRERELEARE